MSKLPEKQIPLFQLTYLLEPVHNNSNRDCLLLVIFTPDRSKKRDLRCKHDRPEYSLAESFKLA